MILQIQGISFPLQQCKNLDDMARKKIEYFETTDALLEGYGLSAKGDGEKRIVYLRGKKLSTKEDAGVSLYLSFRSNGKTVKYYLGDVLSVEAAGDKTTKSRNEETMRQARAIADEKNAEAQRDKNGFSLAKKSRVSLIPYINKLADEELERTGNKCSYYYHLHALAKHIVAFRGDRLRLSDVDTVFIREFVEYLNGKAENDNMKRAGKGGGLSRNTQTKTYNNLKWVIKKAIRKGLVNDNPFDKIETDEKPKGEQGTREYLSKDDVARLMAEPMREKDNLKEAFLFSCFTGLRFSDVSELTWGNILDDGDGCPYVDFRMKKVGREQRTYLCKDAVGYLPERGDKTDDDRIFVLPLNKNANKRIDRWAKSAGVKKKVTFHVARHTAATLLLSLEVPIETVSKFLGHKKIATTQIYARVLDEAQKKAVVKFDGFFDR